MAQRTCPFFCFPCFLTVRGKGTLKEVETTSPGSLWQFLSVLLLFDCTVGQRGFFLRRLRRLCTHTSPLGVRNLLQKTNPGLSGKGKLSEMLQLYASRIKFLDENECLCQHQGNQQVLVPSAGWPL